MADDRPDFIPHTASAGDDRPDFIPHDAAPSTTPSTTAPATPAMKQPAPGYEFGKNVATGMGFDADKIEAMETDPGGGKHPMKGALEMGKQFMQGTGKWMEATAKDPLHIADPVVSAGEGVYQGLKKMWEQPSVAAAGQLTGSLANVGALNAPEHVQRAFKTAASLIGRQPTIEQGKIGYVNGARQAVAKLDNAVRTSGVGARAQSVIEADKLDLAQSQSPGKVNTTEAVLAGQRMMDKTKMGAAPGGYPAQMSMDSAKALITQLGREASRMERTGKAPEAAAVWAEYDALRKATQDRAAELGGEHGKNWRDYIAEHKNYMQLQNGLLGHIAEGEHTTAFNKLLEHSGQLPELQKWFDKYKVDMSPIRDAAKQGKVLHELTQTSSNAVMGKIKLLSRHWALGLPALAGAHIGASALGLGGGIGGFILPLIIAGKLGGLLDKMQVKSLLYDLHSKLPPEQFQVAGSPKGPLESLHNAASAPPAQAAPPPPGDMGAPQPTAQPEPTQPPTPAVAQPSPYTGPEQRVSPAGGYEGPERRSQAQQDYTSAIESTPPGQPTPGESLAEQVRQARAGKPTGISEGDALRKIMSDPDLYEKYKEADQKTRDTMLVKAKNEMASGSRSELAGKLQGARSVYKGRR